jgi:hypothetical protein
MRANRLSQDSSDAGRPGFRNLDENALVLVRDHFASILSFRAERSVAEESLASCPKPAMRDVSTTLDMTKGRRLAPIQWTRQARYAGQQLHIP